jgi:AcrR family transcriptional regulator
VTDGVPTRRERARATTKGEITTAARRLLVEQGPQAASLRAIAREMGMTAPGLYRYYTSREELLRHVIADVFSELASAIRRAIEEAAPPPAPAAASGQDDIQARLTCKLVAACRELSRWSLTHKDEFTLLFGVPLPGLRHHGSNDAAEQRALEFAWTFYGLFLELWTALPFPVPADAEIDPALLSQLRRFRAALRADAPAGAMLVLLRCWVLLYGTVAMEVFGHPVFALGDSAPMFEITLSEMASKVGLTYPLPGPRS